MSKHDTQFFNVFSIVIGLLAAFVILVFALARYVGKSEQNAAIANDPQLQYSVQERIANPARVAVAGQDNSALAIAPVTATTTTVVAVSLSNGSEVYEAACKTCHGVGLAGAPKEGDAGEWRTRLAKGKPTLYEHAIKGFTGSAGIMPAKGGRTDISDELVQEAVDHLLAL